MTWLDLGLCFDTHLLFVSSHLFLCSILLSFSTKKFSISFLFLYLVLSCISFCVCFYLFQRLQCAHLFITAYFILTLTSRKQQICAHLHPSYLISLRCYCHVQTCFISSVSIFKIISDYSRRKLGTHSKLFFLPHLSHLINKPC